MNADRLTSTNWLLIVLAANFLFLLVWSHFRNSASSAYWEDRIKQYEFVSDSLRNEVLTLDAKVRMKDGLVMAYLASLDQSLQLLDRAQLKNKNQVAANQHKRDSLLAAFCEEMKQFETPSEICK